MKGTVLELVIVFVILGVVFFSLLIGLKIYNQLTESNVWADNAAGQAAKSGAAGAIGAIDSGMVFLLAGLLISLIASAFFIQTHPIFFLVSLILLIFVVMVSGPLTNAFMEVSQADNFKEEVGSLSISAHIIDYIPYIAVIGGFLVMLALYAKPGGGEI